MKKLIVKCLIFAMLITGTAFPLLYRLAAARQDRFVSKFSYKTESMVTGSSRALLGLNPDRIGKSERYAGPFLNYAFTQVTSPYGETYYNAVCRKLGSGKDQKQKLFILEVNPVSVSAREEHYPEKEMILGRLSVFNMSPNVDYLLSSAQRPAYLLYIDKGKKEEKSATIFHTNGWNEFVQLPEGTDTAKLNREMYEAHRKLFSEFSVSSYRLDWLEKTIRYLSEHGEVVLVRMPVEKRMHALESAYCPEFDSRMEALAGACKIRYLNYFNTEGWSFYDLHHMTAESANRISKAISDTL